MIEPLYIAGESVMSSGTLETFPSCCMLLRRKKKGGSLYGDRSGIYYMFLLNVGCSEAAGLIPELLNWFFPCPLVFIQIQVIQVTGIRNQLLLLVGMLTNVSVRRTSTFEPFGGNGFPTRQKQVEKGYMQFQALAPHDIL